MDDTQQSDDIIPYQTALIPRRRTHEKKKPKEKVILVGRPVGVETCMKCRYGMNSINDYAKMLCNCSGCSPRFEEDSKTWMCYSFVKILG